MSVDNNQRFICLTPFLHNLYKTNHHYTIMNKLLTNPGTIDKYGKPCYNIDKKRGKEQKQ